ncbi:Polcalcin Che a 3 [Vitis vinifera]|uniref:Polcalcin Che a 3 n=1 Tax=Vitis vinifera TaxID=29760 RepID=A0A438C0P4_VITVI|nr:Polcalcin Che a 3 [Vitis vinifera]RVX09689.1 Polcalcin Che a 3 [Vitis vinifera]
MADNPQDQEERERIFKRFDTNGDGKISSTELGDALKTLGSVSADEVQRMMQEIDTDGDGFISFDEFADFHRANRGLMKDVAKNCVGSFLSITCNIGLIHLHI